MVVGCCIPIILPGSVLLRIPFTYTVGSVFMPIMPDDWRILYCWAEVVLAKKPLISSIKVAMRQRKLRFITEDLML